MTLISDLFELQDTDLEIDSRRAALTEAESRLGESEEVASAAEAVQERQAEVQEAHKQLRAAEWEVDDLTNKIKPLEKKLYAGTVHNPKELSSIEDDIRSIQTHKRVMEDRALEVMSQSEAAEKALDDARRQHATLTADWERQQQVLRETQQGLMAEIDELEKKRAEERAGIDIQALALYDELRAKHQGRAVAKVERGTCGGCRISLPMSLLHKARGGSDAIIQCSSCERILYVS